MTLNNVIMYLKRKMEFKMLKLNKKRICRCKIGINAGALQAEKRYNKLQHVDKININ